MRNIHTFDVGFFNGDDGTDCRTIYIYNQIIL